MIDDTPSKVSRGALLATLAIYILVLLVAGMAGPYWALWMWSLIAFPQYWEGAKRESAGPRVGRLSAGAITVLGLWLVAVGLPLAGLVAGGNRRLPESVTAPLAVLVIGLPVFVTVTLLWWDHSRRSGRLL